MQRAYRPLIFEIDILKRDRLAALPFCVLEGKRIAACIKLTIRGKDARLEHEAISLVELPDQGVVLLLLADEVADLEGDDCALFHRTFDGDSLVLRRTTDDQSYVLS